MLDNMVCWVTLVYLDSQLGRFYDFFKWGGTGDQERVGGDNGKSNVPQHKWDDIKMALPKCLNISYLFL